MKNCENCGGKSYIFLNYQAQMLCKACFSKMTEKRIRLNIRSKDIIGNKPLLVIDDGSAAYGSARFVFENIAKSMPKLKIISSKKPKNGYKTIVCKSLEQECISFMREILDIEKRENFQNPTANIPQPELEKFCEMKNISYKEHKYSQIDSDVLGMLKKISRMRPGALFSLQRISERL